MDYAQSGAACQGPDLFSGLNSTSLVIEKSGGLTLDFDHYVLITNTIVKVQLANVLFSQRRGASERQIGASLPRIHGSVCWQRGATLDCYQLANFRGTNMEV
jgi:hypothetical protein